MGDKVAIKVVSANLAKRQLDYEWVIASGMAEEKQASTLAGRQLKRKKNKKKKK